MGSYEGKKKNKWYTEKQNKLYTASFYLYILKTNSRKPGWMFQSCSQANLTLSTIWRNVCLASCHFWAWWSPGLRFLFSVNIRSHPLCALLWHRNAKWITVGERIVRQIIACKRSYWHGRMLNEGCCLVARWRALHLSMHWKRIHHVVRVNPKNLQKKKVSLI